MLLFWYNQSLFYLSDIYAAKNSDENSPQKKGDLLECGCDD